MGDPLTEGEWQAACLQGRIVSGMAYATKECYRQMLGVKKFIYWVDLTYSNDISWHDEQ